MNDILSHLVGAAVGLGVEALVAAGVGFGVDPAVGAGVGLGVVPIVGAGVGLGVVPAVVGAGVGFGVLVEGLCILESTSKLHKVRYVVYCRPVTKFGWEEQTYAGVDEPELIAQVGAGQPLVLHQESGTLATVLMHVEPPEIFI